MSRPRVADDFPAIRARMEELRRERARVPDDDNLRRADGPRPYSDSSRHATGDKPGAFASNPSDFPQREDRIRRAACFP
jgi:hypothetical protein